LLMTTWSDVHHRRRPTPGSPVLGQFKDANKDPACP